MTITPTPAAQPAQKKQTVQAVPAKTKLIKSVGVAAAGLTAVVLGGILGSDTIEKFLDPALPQRLTHAVSHGLTYFGTPATLAGMVLTPYYAVRHTLEKYYK